LPSELRKELADLDLPSPKQDSIASLNVRFHDFLQVWDRATGEQKHALAKSVFENCGFGAEDGAWARDKYPEGRGDVNRRLRVGRAA
jgi:hypothetical protein